MKTLAVQRTANNRLLKAMKRGCAFLLFLIWVPILIGEGGLFVLSALISMALVKLR